MDLERLGDEVEAVSAVYGEMFGFHRDSSWFVLKLQEEVGELTQAYLRMTGQARDKDMTREQLDASFRAELADVLCHVVLLARHFDVDLQAEVEAKWLYLS